MAATDYKSCCCNCYHFLIFIISIISIVVVSRKKVVCFWIRFNLLPSSSLFIFLNDSYVTDSSMTCSVSWRTSCGSLCTCVYFRSFWYVYHSLISINKGDITDMRRWMSHFGCYGSFCFMSWVMKALLLFIILGAFFLLFLLCWQLTKYLRI